MPALLYCILALIGYLLSNQNAWLKLFQNGSYLPTVIISNSAVTVLTMLGAGLNLCEEFGKFSDSESQFSHEEWNIGIPRAPSSSSSHSSVKKKIKMSGRAGAYKGYFIHRSFPWVSKEVFTLLSQL